MKKLDVRKITLSSMLLALLIVSALISIPVPFLAIKITLQTMILFILASLLSPLYSFITVFLYIAMGLIGLPVFSAGGGIMYILAPSFGFLAAFLVASPLMSAIQRMKFSNALMRYIIACFVGILIIYVIGVPYLYYILKIYMGKNISFSYALIYGGLMFLPFDILKAAAAYPIVSNKYIKKLVSSK